MNNLKQKKIKLIILTLLLAGFSVALIFAINNINKEYDGYHVAQNSIGILFMTLIFLFIFTLILLIILSFLEKRNNENKGVTKEVKQSIDDIDLINMFYIDNKNLKDVDEEMNLNTKTDSNIKDIDEEENEIELPTEVIENTNIDLSKEVIDKVKELTQEEEPLLDLSSLDNSGIEGDEYSRFYNLTQIDNKMKEYLPPKYNNDISLKDICEQFRNYACRNLHLFYDIEDIRRFIGGLAVTKLIILQGMSGTGKTSLAYAFGEFMGNTTTIIPVQPMWKERTDLVGYYNEFTKKFNETALLYKMYEADYNKEIYITVLDEMNIARIEYYFAEFLSLLEIPNLDGRLLDVVSDKWDNDPILLTDKGQIKLPYNMWFIGTANNDDSTFAISDKVYDRAMVLNLDKKAKPFEAPKTDRLKLSIDHLIDLFKEAQKEYAMSDRNLRRIKKLDEYMIKTFHLTFGNRIMKQINEYVPVLVSCGGTEVEAIDDILSRKVFRKLESKNPVYVRQMAEDVCGYLDDLFGVDSLPLCKEAIHLIEQNI